MGVMLFCIILVLAMFVLILFKRKKRVRNIVPIILLVIGIILIMIGFVLNFTSFALGTTDLSRVQVEGYKVNQKIADKSLLVKSNEFEEDTTETYNIIGKDFIYVTISSKDSRINLIDILYDKENYEFENLTLGKSTLSEAEQIFGEEYRNVVFAEMYEKEVEYYDKSNDLILTLGFNDDRLYGIHIEKK